MKAFCLGRIGVSDVAANGYPDGLAFRMRQRWKNILTYGSFGGNDEKG
jgi:hypothetical protein